GRRGRVSVIVVGGPARASDQLAPGDLRSVLPADAEILVVTTGAGATDRADDVDGAHRVCREHPMSVAEQLNLGAQVAVGETLLSCRPGVAPRRGWLPRVRAVLERGGVGAVGPALVPAHAPRHRLFGITLDHEFATFDWIDGLGAEWDDAVEVPVI